MIKKLFSILFLFHYLFAQPLSALAQVAWTDPSDAIEPRKVGGMGFFLYDSPPGYADGSAYQLRGSGGQMWLTEDAIWLSKWEERPSLEKGEKSQEQAISGVHLKISFPDSDSKVKLIPELPMPGQVSLLLGQNPEDWATNLPLWGQLRYQGLYPGVDLVVRSTENGYAWEYEAQPGADLSQLRLWVQGADGILQGRAGTVLQTEVGEIQIPGLGLVGPEGLLESPRTDSSELLTGLVEINPQGILGEFPQLDENSQLSYSTFLGGSERDEASDVAVDAQKNAYFTGNTVSPDFPLTPGGFDSTYNNQDGYVTKIDMTGAAPVLAYSTYLGGNGFERAYSIEVENGIAYVSGETDSSDFPLAGDAADVDAFAVALNATGDDLHYARLIGGSEKAGEADDYGYAIAVENGAAYITGITWSTNFPVTDDSSYGRNGDLFLVKLNSNGDTVFATQKGGRDTDVGFSLDVVNGITWIAGETYSPNFDSILNGISDAFVISFSAIGNVTSINMLGGSGRDYAMSLNLDSAGDIYVTGTTYSADFPVTDGSTFNGGLRDAFVAKLNASNTLDFAAYLGGDGTDQGNGIAFDQSGGVVLTGFTSSTNFPVTDDAYQPALGGNFDAFVTRYFLGGTDPGYRSYSSYLGGALDDTGFAIAMDETVNAYLFGQTRSADFPVTLDGLYQTLNGTQDAFFSVMAVLPPPTVQIQKLTNGLDADLAPGTYYVPGTEINWTYIVTNTGDIPLTNVVVSDNRGVPVSCPSTELPYGGSMVCTAPPGTAIEGQYSNLGLVTADTPYSTTISDVDPSHYFGAAPEATLVKLTNEADANTAPGIFIEESSTITWTYEITNTGNVDLTDIIVIDNNGTPGNPDDDVTICTLPLLQPGEADTTTCLMNGTAEAGQYSNIAVVTGTPPGGLEAVSADDPSYYFGSAPAIDLTKKLNGVHVTAAPGPYLLVGDPITWTYEITNTGNVTLTNVTVVDDNGTPGDPGDDRTACSGLELAPLAAHTCSLAGTAQAGAYHNVATVTGTPPVGSLIPVADHSYYFGSDPVVTLEYSVDGDLADTPPGYYVLADSDLALAYLVSNTGNVTLTNVIVADDLGVTIDCPKTTLIPAESMTCTAFSTALEGQHSATANVTATPPSPLSDVTAEDPMYYFGATPSLTVDKRTNGQEAVTAPGVYVLTGSSVEWTYYVTNTGNVTLTGVTVLDDNGTPGDPSDDVVPDGCDAVTLGPTQGTTCTLSGIAQAGQYTNIASVSGNPPPPLTAVGSSDTSNYYGATLVISLAKQTNGQDADKAPGPLIGVGEPVNWTYTITNASNVTVTFEIVDDPSVEITCPKYSLSTDEAVLCTASGNAEAGQYSNTATVTATPPGGLAPVITQDTSHYFGVITGLDIEKSTNGQDADTAPGPLILIGDPVNWTYMVTNTGNVTVTEIIVTDDQGVTVSCPDSSLAPSASMTCTASGTALVGQYANIGSATANPPTGFSQVSDSDPSHYFGVDPGVELQKYTNGVDAVEAPGPYILVGEAVSWTYVITNVGNITISNFTVSDDQLGAVSDCPTTTLGPGDATTCSASGVAVSGQYTNTGSVTAWLLGLEGSVQASDKSYYFGADPSIQIVKKTNGYDANEAPGPYIPVGESVATTYEISNNETVYSFTEIVVTDESGFIPECPQTTLTAGESMTCTASSTAAEGQQSDTATVNADAWLGGEQPANLGQISAEDTDHYFGYALDLDLVKYTNGNHVSDPPGPEIFIGDEVIWTYEVTNNSNVPISDVSVQDDDPEVVVICPFDALESGVRMTCTASGEAIEGQYANLGAVNAQFNGGPVFASDASYYLGIQPHPVYLPIVIR